MSGSKHCEFAHPGAVAHVLQHGGVGLGLDCVQLCFSEVTNWKGVPDTEPVNGLVEDLAASAGQATGVHHPCIVEAFLLEHLHLLCLVHGCLVAPQVFDGFGVGNMGDGYCLSMLAGDPQGCRWLGCVHYGWCSIGGKLEMNHVVLAFAEFQFLIGCSEYVMPQLTVLTGLFQKLLNGCVEAHCIHCQGQVGSVVDIIHKSQKVNGGLDVPVWTCIAGSSLGFGAVQIIQSARDEQPVKWRVPTALPSAKPRAFPSVLCMFS